MSNIALIAVVLVVVLGFLILGTKGVTRLLLVVGVAAIGLVVLLLWRGTLSTTEIKDTVIRSVDDVRGTPVSDDGAIGTSTSNQDTSNPEVARDEADVGELLNSLRVEGSVPATCREAAWTAGNRAAPRKERVAAIRRLVENGVAFRRNGQRISGESVLDLLD